MSIFFDRDHTWRFDSPSQTTAPNILTEKVGFVGYLVMDFEGPLPTDAAIASIDSAVFADVEGKTKPVISSSAVSYDRMKALLQVTLATTTPGTYVVTVAPESTDEQTVPRSGILVVNE